MPVVYPVRSVCNDIHDLTDAGRTIVGASYSEIVEGILDHWKFPQAPYLGGSTVSVDMTKEKTTLVGQNFLHGRFGCRDCLQNECVGNRSSFRSNPSCRPVFWNGRRRMCVSFRCGNTPVPGSRSCLDSLTNDVSSPAVVLAEASDANLSWHGST